MTRPAPYDRFERFVTRAAGSRTSVVVGAANGFRAAITGLPHYAGSLTSARDDPRALASAFASHGPALLRDLHGTFSLVIASDDGDEWLLAIDRLGIETLCHAQIDGALCVAADANSLAADLRGGQALSLGGPGGLDPQALFDYLYFHCIPGPSTVYRGVTRLLAGHALHFRNGGATVEPYWSPTYDEQSRAPLAELEAGFLSTVEASVARSIDGAVRPAAFLSGGTDSSTVTGMLGRVTGAPPRAYSIGFDAAGFDEIGYARIAAKRFGAVHREYYITPADLVDSIPRIAATFEQPFGNSSVLPTYYCARMAEADGVDRLLGGDGGDELFGGNSRYAKQRVFGYFDRAPAPLRAGLRGALAPSFWSAVPVVKKAQSYVRQADVGMPDRMQTYNLLTRIGPTRMFTPEFLAQVDPEGPATRMREWYARSQAKTLLNRMLAFDLKYTLTDNDLPKVVTACRAAGVPVAFPFLDDAVVAFAERLDPELKLKGFKLRWFFKHALRDFLPTEIIEKTKHGFGLPFGVWLQRDARLKAFAFDSLQSLKARGIVSPSFIDQLRRDLLDDHATYYGEIVWVLMMLEQWLVAHDA